jgi:hypothetical protein
MKNFTLILAFGIIGAVAGIYFAKYYQSVKGPFSEIFLENYLIDTGEYIEGDNVSLNLNIKNIGNSILKINHIDSGCSCTIAELEKDEINASDSLIIHIKYNKSDEIGFFKQHVKIDHSGINSPTLFTFTGRIISNSKY